MPEVFQAVLVPMEIGDGYDGGSASSSFSNSYHITSISRGYDNGSMSISSFHRSETKRLLMKVGVLVMMIVLAVVFGSSGGGKNHHHSDEAASLPYASGEEGGDTWTNDNGDEKDLLFHPATPLVCPYASVISPQTHNQLAHELLHQESVANSFVYALFYYPVHHDEETTIRDMTIWSKVAFNLTTSDSITPTEHATVEVVVVNCHMVMSHHTRHQSPPPSDGQTGGSKKYHLNDRHHGPGTIPDQRHGDMPPPPSNSQYHGAGSPNGNHQKDPLHNHDGSNSNYYYNGMNSEHEQHEHHSEDFIAFNACEELDIFSYPSIAWYDDLDKTQRHVMSLNDKMDEQMLLNFAFEHLDMATRARKHHNNNINNGNDPNALPPPP